MQPATRNPHSGPRNSLVRILLDPAEYFSYIAAKKVNILPQGHAAAKNESENEIKLIEYHKYSIFSLQYSIFKGGAQTYV